MPGRRAAREVRHGRASKPVCEARSVTSHEKPLPSEALTAVLRELPNSSTDGSSREVIKSWSDDEAIYVVYRMPGVHVPLGLRRTVELDRELVKSLDDWVDEVVNSDLG